MRQQELQRSYVAVDKPCVTLTGMASQKRPPGKSGDRPAGFMIGRVAFEKISAVEGIRPTEASRSRAIESELRGLSAEERRREIIRAHRPKR